MPPPPSFSSSSNYNHKIFFFGWFFLIAISGFAQQSFLEIANLTGNFYIYTTYKEINGTPFPSNSMYVVTDSGVIMIDTPWDQTQTEPLLDSIEKKHHQKVMLCIVTHFHDDRTAGLDILKQKGVKTYSTIYSSQKGKENGEKTADFYITKDTIFNVGGVSFETYYPGEGHTADNIVVWFPGSKILYGGCFVKSIEAKGLGNIADANIENWPNAIKKTIKKFKSPKYIIPGHQGWYKKNALMHTLYLLQTN